VDIANTCTTIINEDLQDVLGVWIFGSVASGLDVADSDIDLAVLSTDKIDKVRLWKCSQRIASAVRREVDLVDLIDASTVMRSQIVQSGKRIYCADNFICDKFETEALTDYLRFNEERREILEDIKSRGRVLGTDG